MVEVEAAAGEVGAGEIGAGDDFTAILPTANLSATASIAGTQSVIRGGAGSLSTTGTLATTVGVVRGVQTTVLDAGAGEVGAGEIGAGEEGNDRGLFAEGSVTAPATVIFQSIDADLSGVATLGGARTRIRSPEVNLQSAATLAAAIDALLFSPIAAHSGTASLQADFFFLIDVSEKNTVIVTRDLVATLTVIDDTNPQVTVEIESI